MSELVSRAEAAALADLDEARRIIDLAYHEGDIATLREVHDRAAALAVYHRSRDKADIIREVQVRAARDIGRLDLASAPNGVRADRRSTSLQRREVDLGVSNQTRANWRRLAEVPDHEFDEHLDRLRGDENTGITTAGAVRLARGTIAGSALMSSASDDWSTPQDIYDRLNLEFAFDLDVCATAANAKCARYFTPDQDGLAQTWEGACWMNPPYGRDIGRWVHKAHESAGGGAVVVCLVPARTDTDWFWTSCRHGEIRLIRGRLRFGGAETGAPFPSCVVVFGPDVTPTVRFWEP